MSKAVLVMDEMPEDCTMCKFWNSKDDECYATGAEELSLNSEEAKPDPQMKLNFSEVLS